MVAPPHDDDFLAGRDPDHRPPGPEFGPRSAGQDVRDDGARNPAGAGVAVTWDEAPTWDEPPPWDEAPPWDDAPPPWEDSPARDAAAVAAPRPVREAVAAGSMGRPADRARSAPVTSPPVGQARPAGRTDTRPVGMDLDDTLHKAFGFKVFRPHQREVCEAVVAGTDALLVMPTGGGKSLCYQLPGLVRGGCTLVISPLIALMEDQVAKLQQRGLRAERIHSGRDRQEQREALHAYLAGQLDYLMIAPERLKVPGFSERLATRPPTLIAVDEAHCISMWGHDFRPDYRLLGERLPQIAGADGVRVPILAMTATATVRVQRDIVRQLGMPHATRFIRGFARENLAIEIVETPVSERLERVMAVLAPADRRPALVYALSRKMTEQLAADLKQRGGLRAAAYHAGLSPERRGRVQDAFQSGEIEVVAATVAFGMGVDKANIRTVVHVGMPGTIEGFYQEIGRAGRGGKPSRAVALYSWADRRLHDFLRDRSYPPLPVLQRLLRQVPAGGLEREELLRTSGVEVDVAEAAVDKLWVHGAVAIDAGDRLTPLQRVAGSWSKAYQEQCDHRVSQLDDVFELVRMPRCRMQALVHYFGSLEEARRPCGNCDHCRPEDCRARDFSEPDPEERVLLQRIVAALGVQSSISAAKLFRDQLASWMDRRAYDRLLDGLERAGLVEGHTDSFEKDGRTISYRRIQLSDEARSGDGGWLETVVLPAATAVAPKAPKKTRRKAASKPRKATDRASGAARVAGDAGGARVVQYARGASVDEGLLEELKAWRLAKARTLGLPAYCVLTNRALEGVAAALPRTRDELLAVSGIGPKVVERYGDELLEELNR